MARSLSVVALVVLLGYTMASAQTDSKGANNAVLAEWRFTGLGGVLGWQPNGHFADITPADSGLQLRGSGSDPILEYQPNLDLPAQIWSIFEVRMKADRDGTAELFWSNTREGRYGGFSQEKATRFPVRGDGRWHTYRVRPCWHPEGRIRRLRFDLYDASRFEIQSLRVLGATTEGTPVEPEFEFSSSAAGWHAEEGAKVRPSSEGLRVRLPDSTAFLAAPAVSIPAERLRFLSLRMSATAGAHATFLFVSAERPQLQRFSFPIEADGREHLYNIDLGAAQPWRGRIVGLGLRPSNDPKASVVLRSLGLFDAPQGVAQLNIRWFGMEQTQPRVGESITMLAVVENLGGATATNIAADLHIPGTRTLQLLPTSGVQTSGRSVAQIPALPPGEPLALRWAFVSDRPAATQARLVLKAPGVARVQGKAPLRITPRSDASRADYVPEPHPVRGPLEVGVYYFPGWGTPKPWEPIRKFPERRPALGYYREGSPEIADWHIKWAVEHGITFFIYDWYWDRGHRQLEHGLHDGYFKARYRSLLKFCLLWANHNPPGTSSLPDCLDVTRFWITNYFRQPEHMTMDGKPLMVIFAPHRLTEDLGTTNVRPALDAMRAECVRAGLKGLYLVACVGDAAQARQAAAEGYDAVTSYTWPHLNVPAGEWRAPFSTILAGYRSEWAHIAESAGIPLLPPVCGGWDSRPWHGENNYIRTGRTPALFEQHLRDARQFVESAASPARVRPVLILEAWNEWGEGSYIEPHQEFGFGFLDSIRSALTTSPARHQDLTPANTGRDPSALSF
jgi:hypothetical protein